MILIKPVKYDKYIFAEIFSSVLFGGLINLIVGIVLCLSIDTYLPMDLLTIILFFVSFINALIMKYIIVYAASLLSFWTHNVHGVLWTRVALVSFFSGALIPMNFFPNWLKIFSEYLPFQTIVNIPVQIYMSKISIEYIFWLITLQILWILVFWFIAKMIFLMGIKKVTIHGG